MEDPSFKLKEQAQLVCTELFNLGENSMFLSVNAANQTSTILGSSQGMIFLQSRLDIIEQFYKYCSGQQMTVDNKKDAGTMTDEIVELPTRGQSKSHSESDNTNMNNSMTVLTKESNSKSKKTTTEVTHEGLNAEKLNVSLKKDQAVESRENESDSESHVTTEIDPQSNDDIAEHNLSIGDIFESEKENSNTPSSELPYSDDKENVDADQSEKKEKANDKSNSEKKEKTNDQSNSWKDRLTRKRKPSAVVLEAQKGKGYTKITVTRGDNKNKDAPSIKQEIKTENTETPQQKKIKKIKQEAEEQTFDIYVSGEKVFEGVTELNDETKMKQKPITDLKVEGTDDTGYFVDFEKFDEYKILAPKKAKKPKEVKFPSEPEVFERSSDGGYICSYCGKVCRTKIWLKRHRRMHTDERPYKCAVCGKTYRQYGHLLKHKISHNPEHRPHMCDICGKTFSYVDSLKSHKKLHQDLPPCKCDDCGKVFARVELLKQHLAFKKQGYDFMCEICGNTFRQKDTLRRHLLTHDKNRKPEYECPHCDKKFFRKATFKVHLDNHEGNYKYVCSCCDLVFSSKATLKKHVRRKMGLLPKSKPQPKKTNKKNILESSEPQEVVEQSGQFSVSGEPIIVSGFIEQYGATEVYPVSAGEEVIYVIDASELADHQY